MKKYSTIAAFTIVEAVVSMAITAIILAIVFVIFSITSQRLNDFKKQNDGISDLNRLSYSVNKAIFENDVMSLSDENQLTFKDYQGKETRYNVYEKYLIREKGDYLDTFKLVTKQMYIDVLPAKTGKSKYQRLKWDLSANGKLVSFSFYKKIYAHELFNSAVKDEF